MFEFLIALFDIPTGLVFLSGHLTNANCFKGPLTQEEEFECFIKFKKTGDLEAKNILIERNLRLVAHIVKKYANTYGDVDDFISIGTIGLIKAVCSYEVDKGTRFSTYAARCIENEILMNLRSNKKLNNVVSLHEPIGVDKEGNEISLIDVVPCAYEDIADVIDLKIQIKKLYDKMQKALKNREKKILELRYGLLNGAEKTQIEIAKMLGISRSYVSRIEKKAISKLTKEFKDSEDWKG